MSHPLRKLAEGKSCMARIPGICNWNSETTVLAHVRRGNIAGVGQKPSDLCAFFCCSACHDCLDRRTHKDMPIEVINDYTLDALVRQLDWYDRHEILIVTVAA